MTKTFFMSVESETRMNRGGINGHRWRSVGTGVIAWLMILAGWWGVGHQAAGAEAELDAARFIEFRVSDDETNRPLSGVKVEASFTTKTVDHRLTTDEHGMVKIKLPAKGVTLEGGYWKTNYLRIEAFRAGYVRTRKLWHQKDTMPYTGQEIEGSFIPSYIGRFQTMRLKQAQAIGGKVVDEKGRPIQGVEIKARSRTVFEGEDLFRFYGDISFSPGPMGESAPQIFETPVNDEIVPMPCKTNKLGIWKYENIEKINPEWHLVDIQGNRRGRERERIELHADHDDYMVNGGNQGMEGFLYVDDYARLMKGEFVLVMHRAAGVNILLRDDRGQPVRDAMVSLEPRPYLPGAPSSVRRFWDGKRGLYRLFHVHPGKALSSIQAPKHVPATELVTLDYPYPTKTITLMPILGIHGRVVDQFEKPFKTTFRALRWQGGPLGVIHLETDYQGRFEWSEMPTDGTEATRTPGDEERRDTSKPGYDYTLPQEIMTLTQRREPYLIQMERMLSVKGKVLDAGRERSLEEFSIFEGVDRGSGKIEWMNEPVYQSTGEMGEERANRGGKQNDNADADTKHDELPGGRAAFSPGSDGTNSPPAITSWSRYYVVLIKPKFRHYLRAEAPGYEPAISPGYEKITGEVIHDFRLKPVGSGKTLKQGKGEE